MFQYFISEINIDKITNTTIEKLKEKFEFNESVENIIYSREGYYVIKDNTVAIFTRPPISDIKKIKIKIVPTDNMAIQLL